MRFRPPTRPHPLPYQNNAHIKKSEWAYLKYVPFGLLIHASQKRRYLNEYYSMLSTFLTSGVMSVSAAGSKYAKPADAPWSPAVLNTAI